MLNTHKLLYLLPDVAYITELLPGKKAHSFSIQSFRQINGQLIDEDNFLIDNLRKLFDKIESEEYQVVLPDYLFTNTIISVKESDSKKIEQHVRETLLPSLGITNSSHQIHTSILTSFKGESKVQLSAIEHTVLLPLKQVVNQAKITIANISPLSWTIKSIVSLEPSITLLQMGTQVTTALHYIGVDQTNQFPLDDFEAIAESIKTLKGSEPNIQTLYLISNDVVETELKELLSNTIPLQQLSLPSDQDDKIPPYIKISIESGMKTFSISDYPVPYFSLSAVKESEVADSLEEKDSSSAEDIDDVNQDIGKEEFLPTSPAQPVLPISQAPQPTLPEPITVATLPEPETATQLTEPIELESIPESTSASPSSSIQPEITSQPQVNNSIEESAMNTSQDINPKSTVQTKMITPESNDSRTENSKIVIESTPPSVSADEPHADTKSENNDIDLTQFVTQTETSGKILAEPTIQSKAKGGKPMGKIILLGIIVFIATIAIGVGIGVGLVSYSGRKTPTPPIQVEESQTVSPTVTIEPSPTASPSAELVLEDLSILVVNATTTAGLAGTVSSSLQTAGVGSTSAGNAKGTYTSATTDLILMKKDNPSLVSDLSKAINRTLKFSEGIGTEDSAGTYDAVIVLTQSK